MNAAVEQLQRYYEVSDLLNALIKVADEMSLGTSFIEALFEELKDKEKVGLVNRERFDEAIRRLKHLLQSDYIRSFDERVPFKGSYIRDIREADREQMTVSTSIYNKATRYSNCTVEVLENTATGETSVGWYRTEETEEIDDL